jgi:hypothetical protein
MKHMRALSKNMPALAQGEEESPLQKLSRWIDIALIIVTFSSRP